MFGWLLRLPGSRRLYSPIAQDDIQVDNYPSLFADDGDADFGGHQARIDLERQLLRKVDARMLMLIVIYILNYMDRNSVAAARLRGFEEDLHLKGEQFNTILSVFQIGYAMMQVPSNMFLNYNGKPSIYLPSCMMIWGLISVLSGTVTNFFGAAFASFSLGVVEAAFLPGAAFLISKWYKRSEIGFRMAVLFCGSPISNAFGALLASIILDVMEGTRGQAAWRWLFFIEGGLTVLVAFIAFYIVPDFPSTSNFLTPLERQLALKRMEEDAGSDDSEETNPQSGFLAALQDWKVWCLALAQVNLAVNLSLNVFFPTLTATLGYGTTVTLLLCAPPWLFAAGISFVVTRHSDMIEERFYHITGPLAVGLVGFAMAAWTMNTAARYLSLFLMTISLAGLPTSFAWISSTISRPSSKRAVAFAFINALSQMGNVAGSYVWPKSWGPSYVRSCLVCMSTSALAITFYWILRERLKGENIREEEREMREGRGKGFRYIL